MARNGYDQDICNIIENQILKVYHYSRHTPQILCGEQLLLAMVIVLHMIAKTFSFQLTHLEVTIQSY